MQKEVTFKKNSVLLAVKKRMAEEGISVPKLAKITNRPHGRLSNWIYNMANIPEEDIIWVLRFLKISIDDIKSADKEINEWEGDVKDLLKQYSLGKYKKANEKKKEEKELLAKMDDNILNDEKPFETEFDKLQKEEEEKLKEQINMDIDKRFVDKKLFKMRKGIDLPEQIRPGVFAIRGYKFKDSSENKNEAGVLLFNGEQIIVYTGITEVYAEFIIVPLDEHVLSCWVDLYPMLIYDKNEEEFCIPMYCRGIDTLRIFKGDVVAYALYIRDL